VPGSTSNLGPGFDVLGLALKIYLTVTVAEADKSEIECVGEGAQDLPRDASNLIMRAIAKSFERAGKAVPPLKLRVDNEIPLTRGLGSSGAATIAGLLCGNRLAQAGLDETTLITLATTMEGHPENAASSLLGGLTVNCVTNDQIISKRVEADPELLAVLLIPEAGVSTRAARRVLPATISYQHAVFNLQRCASLTRALIARDYSSLRALMQDKLHQPFRSNLVPHYADFEKCAYENGALGFCISGSGSTVLAFTRYDARALQDAMEKNAIEKSVPAKVRIVGVENEGAQFLETAAAIRSTA